MIVCFVLGPVEQNKTFEDASELVFLTFHGLNNQSVKWKNNQQIDSWRSTGGEYVKKKMSIWRQLFKVN